MTSEYFMFPSTTVSFGAISSPDTHRGRSGPVFTRRVRPARAECAPPRSVTARRRCRCFSPTDHEPSTSPARVGRDRLEPPGKGRSPRSGRQAPTQRSTWTERSTWTGLEAAVASADAEIESLRDAQETEFASVRSEAEVLRSDPAELRSIMTSIRGVFAREDFDDEAGPRPDA